MYQQKGLATQQQVELRAGGWALLQACINAPSAAVSSIDVVLATPAVEAATPGAFGISIAGTGKPGSLMAFAFSWRSAPRGALLSSQNFLDADTLHSGSTVFTGVPVGTAKYLPGAIFTPQLAVANFGSRPATATVRFARTNDSGPEASEVATVRVPARSAQTIELPLLTGDPGLRNSFIVQSDAAPGTLLASLAAVGAPGFGLVEQIGKDEQVDANGGGHPWDLSGGQDAVLLLFNHSAVAKYFNVKIGSGGVLWQQAYQLAPMESRAISIRELIEGQLKDEHGAVLPQSLEQGEISWFNPNPAEGKGRLMQIEPATQTVAGNVRVARNFSCGYCLTLCGAYLQTDLIVFPYSSSSDPLALGPVVPYICNAYYCSACGGNQYGQGGSGYNYSWWSNNTSIATVSGSSTSSTAMFFGNGVGTGSATGEVMSAYCQEEGGGTPTVAKLTCTPSPVTRGASVTCSVTGTSASSITWSFSGGGGSVNGPSGMATWSGVMVQSGTVTAATANGSLTQNITVNGRSGWATSPVAAQVGTVPGCVFVSPPPNSSATLGCSTYQATFNIQSTILSGGPNDGYSYYDSKLNLQQSFPYQIHPDVSNQQSTFSVHQYGACGYLSASQLLTNVTWHESNSAPHSHYNQYVTSLATNNPGTFLESQVGTPGHPAAAGSQVQALLNRVTTDAASEVNLYGPNYNQSTGAFMGNINYPPYASCPP